MFMYMRPYIHTLFSSYVHMIMYMSTECTYVRITYVCAEVCTFIYIHSSWILMYVHTVLVHVYACTYVHGYMHVHAKLHS